MGEATMTHLEFVRMEIPSLANQRMHWARKASITRGQRMLAGQAVSLLPVDTTKKLIITLCRQSPRLLDDDNLASALKGVRDGVADGLRLKSDRQSDRLVWKYEQYQHTPQGACITIEEE
jgi:hypothetical protein